MRPTHVDYGKYRSIPQSNSVDEKAVHELPEPHVTGVTSVPILIFQGLCVLELDTMYATDRQTSDTHDC